MALMAFLNLLFRANCDRVASTVNVGLISPVSMFAAAAPVPS